MKYWNSHSPQLRRSGPGPTYRLPSVNPGYGAAYLCRLPDERRDPEVSTRQSLKSAST